MIENEVYLSEPVIEIRTKEVHIKHVPSNENAIYDICSLEGRVLITGRFKGRNTVVDLEGYPEGLYNIFILDGSQLYKNSFRL